MYRLRALHAIQSASTESWQKRASRDTASVIRHLVAALIGVRLPMDFAAAEIIEGGKYGTDSGQFVRYPKKIATKGRSGSRAIPD
jgi:hypothetical protein